MCCFSQSVKSVSNTRIFARAGEGGRQYVAYQMNLSAAEDLAMVLPIPVKSGSGEKAVQFLSLEKYPDFFADMRKGFPEPAARSGRFTLGFKAPTTGAVLEVHRVGAFDASYVPTAGDFDRLDERFRIPSTVWAKLPGYDAFGFAVFKLRAGDSEVHPMAFSFPSAVPNRVFFPTVHIHDGKIHSNAEFDHTVYAQGGSVVRMSRLWVEKSGNKTPAWRESRSVPTEFMKVRSTQGMVLPGEHLHQLVLRGTLRNSDLFVEQDAPL